MATHLILCIFGPQTSIKMKYCKHNIAIVMKALNRGFEIAFLPLEAERRKKRFSGQHIGSCRYME